MKQTRHRWSLIAMNSCNGEDADFIAYRRKFGDGLWHTVSMWMIPPTQVR
jgi:hypothetical protein